MQTVSNNLSRYATSPFRTPSVKLLMSWDKEYDDTTTFFTLDSSDLDGPDVLSGTNSAIQEWNKYQYVDYSDRVISAEWTREKDDPYSVGQAYVDLVLDNYDDFFTPGAGSDIDGNILPGRPIRLFAGFSGEYIQVFVGLTESRPVLNHRDKTAKIHCLDYLSSIYKKPLTDAITYQDMRVDEIIEALLLLAGFTSGQYVLDEAYNTINIAYFKSGMKLGDALDKLVQSDLGTLMMDENGVIRYENRQNFSDTPVYAFTDDNVIDSKTTDDNKIINVVEINSELRELSVLDKIYGLTKAQLIEAGETVTIPADFNDPLISVVTPVHVDSAVAESSLYDTNTQEDGNGTTSAGNITLLSTNITSTRYEMTFENTSGVDMYITSIQLWGVIAPVYNKLTLREEAADSVESIGEEIYEINNPYIQNTTLARSLQLLLLSQRSEAEQINELTVWGTPALQLNDSITYNGDDFFITKQKNRIAKGTGYRQVLSVTVRKSLTIFTLDESYLDGPDVLGVA